MYSCLTVRPSLLFCDCPGTLQRVRRTAASGIRGEALKRGWRHLQPCLQRDRADAEVVSCETNTKTFTSPKFLRPNGARNPDRSVPVAQHQPAAEHSESTSEDSADCRIEKTHYVQYSFPCQTINTLVINGTMLLSTTDH